ncbi:MAG: glutamine amidotransferase [Thermoguttaceae bacterium]|jgi:GMP synthase (glutamine-hydrolysing)
MRPLLIVKLGTTFPTLAAARGDFDDWIRRGLGLPANQVAVLDAHQEPCLPDPRQFAGLALTGSHGMVTDQEAWSQRVAGWIPTILDAAVPLLGICYGHQLIAHALGGEVGWNPGGREFGTVEIHVHATARHDRLFGSLPERLTVHVCHAQSVLRLPPGATCLASNPHEPHHAFVVGQTAWGVQFHPEFDTAAVKTYVTECADLLRRDGADPDQLFRTVTDTPQSNALLRRFGAMCTERRG